MAIQNGRQPDYMTLSLNIFEEKKITINNHYSIKHSFCHNWSVMSLKIYAEPNKMVVQLGQNGNQKWRTVRFLLFFL